MHDSKQLESKHSTKTFFECKRILIKDEKNEAIPAMQINVYNEIAGEKKEIFENTIKLGMRNCVLSLPVQGDFFINKDGDVIIHKCQVNNDISFKLLVIRQLPHSFLKVFPSDYQVVQC